MAIKDPSRPAALELALRMQAQIRCDRPPPGSSFLGAEAAARQFGVRKAVANQALQILAHRGVITRKPRLGAVIAAQPIDAPELARIVIVTQADYEDTEAEQEGAITSGLQSVFPGSDVELQALEGLQAEKRIDELFRAALKSGSSCGVILIRGSLALQQKVADCGLPAVVFGSVWPGVKLSAVNIDNAAIAKVLTQALSERGADRLLLLRRDRTSPGENALLQGAIDVTRDLGWPLDVLELPESRNFARAALRETARKVGAKCAVLAATPMLARVACQAMPDRPVACGSIHPIPGYRRVLRCETVLDVQQHGQLLGRLLRTPDAPPQFHELTCRLNLQSTMSQNQTP